MKKSTNTFTTRYKKNTGRGYARGRVHLGVIQIDRDRDRGRVGESGTSGTSSKSFLRLEASLNHTNSRKSG